MRKIRVEFEYERFAEDEPDARAAEASRERSGKSPPPEWSEQQQRAYVKLCAGVVEQCRGTSPCLEEIFAEES
jgi:hypothetical protein